MKRIFISVGSQGSRALKGLICRLREENIFDKFGDYYIAFDTDEENLADFQTVNDLTPTQRIQGYQVEIDNREDHVVENFDSDWNWTEIGAGGVGGDRRISRKAAACIRNVWNDVNLGLDANLQSDDHIIVVGSAFGGTSGGMFVNVCQYLDYVIRSKRNTDTDYKKVQIHGFLLMPKGENDPNYPGATNMIDMFRNLQTASWQRRLETSRPGFKVPTLIKYEHGYFQLFSGTNNLLEYGIQGSTLPMSALYLVPSAPPMNEGDFTDAVYTEALFAATYLRICEGHNTWVNRLNNPRNLVATQVTAEDNCISGFNMFAMKSGRTRSLKHCFYKEIKMIIQGQNGKGGVLGNYNADDGTIENIVSVFEKIQTPGRDDQYAGLENEEGSPLRNLIDAFKNLPSYDELVSLKNKCTSSLNTVADRASGYQILSVQGLIAALGCCNENWLKSINFQSIQSAYEKFHTAVKAEAEKLDTYKKMIQAAVDTACHIAEVRCAESWNNPVRYLKQEAAVFEEIATALNAAFNELLGRFLFASRCKNTQFIAPEQFTTKPIQDVCKSLVNYCDKELKVLSNDGNPYIAEGQLDDSLTVLPEINFNPMAIVVSSCYKQLVAGSSIAEEDKKLLLQVINNLRDLNVNDKLLREDYSCEQIMQHALEDFITEYIRIATADQAVNNPLLNVTFAQFDPQRHKTYAPVLQVPDSKAYHHHFVIQLGNAPDGFSMTNEDVADPNGALKITTMPGTANKKEQFLSVTHNNTQDGNSWSGNRPDPRPLFQGAKANTTIDIQGLWIGTLGIDFRVRETICNIYAGVRNITPTWTTEGAKDLRRREMTTVEMLKFGLIIEAIGDKFREKWNEYKQMPGNQAATVAGCKKHCAISFRNNGNTVALPAETPNALGFVERDDQIQIEKITKEWVKEIMAWLRSADNSSFNAFFPRATFTSVHNTETDIFNHMRFSITNDELAEMDAVKTAILRSLEVQI